MRLIDADALKEHLSNRYMSEVYPDWYQLPLDVREKIGLLGKTFKCAILEAPTVDEEPAVHAYWTGAGDCSACHYMGLYNGNEEVERSRFCPHCGAKMDGGAE